MTGYFQQFVKLFFNPGVSLSKKFIFLLVVLLYWIFPDLIPFMPLDDVLFTLLSIWAFIKSAQNNAARKNENSFDKKESVIDVQGQVIDDEK